MSSRRQQFWSVHVVIVEPGAVPWCGLGHVGRDPAGRTGSMMVDRIGGSDPPRSMPHAVDLPALPPDWPGRRRDLPAGWHRQEECPRLVPEPPKPPYRVEGRFRLPEVE